MELNDFVLAEKRREYLEKELSIELNNLKRSLVDDKKDIHCENLIGATTTPVGVAGPLQVQSSKLKVQSYYVPLATSEGALVASVNRGCKAVNLSGGIQVFSERVGTTRGPVFLTNSLEESYRLVDWLKKNKNIIAKTAEKTSSHLIFLRQEIKMLNNYVFVRFYFDTSEAMGMNMVTIATDKITQLIKLETGIECLSISGNYCVDKKPAWLNFIQGRGFSVWAEAVIKKEIIEKVLKTTSKRLFEVWLGKCVYGSIMSGSLGFNGHFANVIAAFYLATGQDLAHVVEGSLGLTEMRLLKNDDIRISVHLPAVMIGLIGGGTKLKTKKEALSIIGAKSSSELAGVLGGVVLAGELSLLASLSEGSLAKTHKRLGR